MLFVHVPEYNCDILGKNSLSLFSNSPKWIIIMELETILFLLIDIELVYYFYEWNVTKWVSLSFKSVVMSL